MKEPLEDSFTEGNFFTKLYDAMPLPVYVWKKTEANFVLVSLNSKAKELTKNKPSEILGKNIADFCCNVSEMLGWLNQVCEQKTVLKKESCCDLVFCKKESLFSLTFSYVAEGLVLMLFEEVSNQSEAQHKLFESEEKFRLAFITSHDSININKLENGLCVDVNQGFTEITGYTKEEVLGKTTLELGIWLSTEARQRFVESLLEKGSVKDFEAKFRTKNGKIIVGLMSARIIKLNGEPHIIAVTRDITKRVELEEELRKIYEEQKKLLQAVEQSHSTIIITDSYGNIEYVNQKFTETTGYTFAEVVGRNPRFLKSGKHTPQFYRELWQTVSAGEEWKGEFLNKRKNGELYWENASISGIKDENGKIRKIIAVKLDITEQKSLQEQLIQSQKMETIGLLAGGIAHDFNNILTVISGYSDILITQLRNNDNFKKTVLEIKNSSARASQMTRQLLTFSRKQTLELKIISINDLIENQKKMLNRLIGENFILKLNLDPEVKMVNADPTQIEQVIMNIVVNAKDAMPDGGEISITTQNIFSNKQKFLPENCEFVCVSIRDTGSGIPQEILKEIFIPFFTTKKVGKGTGLGLSVVFGIIKQHEGWIDVESEVGSGTIFKIYLPAISQNIDFLEQTKKNETTELDGNAVKILLVEDDEQICNLVKTALTEKNFVVFNASTVREATQILRNNSDFKILFCDIILPDGDGIIFAKNVSEKQKQLKILLTSGYSDENSRLEASTENGFTFLRKPYTLEELFFTFKKICENL